MIWLNHHRVFDQVARVDGPLLLLNLNLLLWTALIPFPTAVVAEHLGRRRGGGADRLGAVQRGAALLTSLAFGGLFAWVTRDARLLERPLSGVVGVARRRFMVGLIVYAVAFALSWVSAPLALALCGLMALY
jgi:hypothetical protein